MTFGIRAPRRVLGLARVLAAIFSLLAAASDDQARAQVAGAPLAPRPGVTHALLIGIAKYQHLPLQGWLPFASADAAALADLLVRKYGCAPVRLTVLLDEHATIDNIDAALAALDDPRYVKPQDQVLVYFAGQSATVHGAAGDSGYLAAYNSTLDLTHPDGPGSDLTTCVPVRDLWKYLGASPASHALVAIDARVGGLGLAKGAAAGGTDVMSPHSLQVIAAGTPGDAGDIDARIGHDALAYALLDQLSSHTRTRAALPATTLSASAVETIARIAGGSEHAQSGRRDDTPGEFGFTPEEGAAAPAGSVEAASAVNIGRGYAREHRYQDAESSFQAALKENPKCTDALIGLGDMYWRYSKDFASSERMYRQAADLAPRDAAPDLALGILYRDATRNYALAEELLKKAMGLAPGDALPVSALGEVEYREKRYDLAEGLYRQAMERDPLCASPVNALGYLYQHVKHDAVQAEQLYRKAMALDPGWTAPVDNLASVDYVRGDYGDAESLYRKAIELDPADADPVNNLAYLVEHTRKDFKQADELYRKALQLDPSFAAAANNLGYVAQHYEKDLVEADRLFRIAIQLDPNDAAYHANLALCLLDRKQYDEAMREAQRARGLGYREQWLFKQFGLQNGPSH